MEKRFVIYGLAGLCMEVVWNGFWSLMKGDINIVGQTSLWMFPIYGLAVLLELVHNSIRDLPTFVRGGVYTLLIFTIEFISGWIFRNIIGVSPWDYGEIPFAVYGLIRLDYAPAWFIAGLLFEKLHDQLISMKNRID
ncbi:hypothetical protein GOM49_01560 [Clostridium bovifaecis]|uniref:Uncharacterized protein n=1 Tax=Clostridium bovifaecis TaxID=2184719 RepID=A0A6I6ENG2_9CLOT|nr:hypothetical protein GOM49_01560 [Clostridium bovifaecis]